MEVKAHTLEQLRTAAQRLTPGRFVDAHPGHHLIAMGLLSIRELTARQLGSTAGINLSLPLRHDPSEKHPLAGLVFSLSAPEGSAVIGRDLHESEITVPDESVSVQHCRVHLGGETLSIEDLRSTNGTKVNLQACRPNQVVALAAEDLLTVGRFSFQYHTASSLLEALQLLDALGR